ncbi:MAG TPA: MFS transporter [Actinomycetota bacterium]|nr:MFS transporter [Actinomycetota bacterium]
MIETSASPRRRLAAGVASVAVLLAALDAYVVVTILVDIMRDMGIPIEHPERATPIVTAYLLGYVAAMPLLGQLSDRIGRTRVIQGCLLFFAVGSVISAAAPTLPVLVGGRLVQGAAGGALLPVTFAVISDLWEARSRSAPLGVVGASQELGSVLGPLYGAGLAALAGWRSVFWVNIPLAAAAMFAVQRGLPPGERRTERRVDLGGGLLLAFALGAMIVGLYNPDTEQAVLPPWGAPFLVVAVLGLLAFVVWERRSASRLVDLSAVQTRPFFASLACSFLSGVALMVTLVDVPLLARTLLGEDSLGGALVLSRFLVALVAGAVAGGVVSGRTGERPVTIAGFLLAAGAYLLISGWPLDISAADYRLGGLSLPRMSVDLVLAGFGLGLVIAPLAAVALRASTPDQHGVVSASVVVARMMGMLIGIAALGAAGVYRFQQLTKDLVPPLPFGVSDREFQQQVEAYEEAIRSALHTEYGELFLVTAVVCALAAAAAIGLGRRPAGRVSASEAG